MFLLLYFLLVTTHQSFTYTYTVNVFSIVMLNVKLKQNKRFKTYMSKKKRQQDKNNSKWCQYLIKLVVRVLNAFEYCKKKECRMVIISKMYILKWVYSMQFFWIKYTDDAHLRLWQWVLLYTVDFKRHTEG